MSCYPTESSARGDKFRCLGRRRDFSKKCRGARQLAARVTVGALHSLQQTERLPLQVLKRRRGPDHLPRQARAKQAPATATEAVDKESHQDSLRSHPHSMATRKNKPAIVKEPQRSEPDLEHATGTVISVEKVEAQAREKSPRGAIGSQSVDGRCQKSTECVFPRALPQENL